MKLIYKPFSVAYLSDSLIESTHYSTSSIGVTQSSSFWLCTPLHDGFEMKQSGCAMEN